MCGVIWAYAGPLEKAEEVFKPIRAFKKPAVDLVVPLPHPALQGMFDALYPTGLQWYWCADFMNEINDAAIESHIKFANTLPPLQSSMHLYPINGAVARINNSDTAWNYRDELFSAVIIGVDPDPVNKDKISTWTKQYWEALHPFSAGGAYLNFIAEEGEDRVKSSYGGNYERLVILKNKYDPDNVFRVIQNIKPK